MLKKPGMILLLIAISGLLSSCHIEQREVETIARTPIDGDKLRIYQANDFIEYSVNTTINSSTTNRGTLRIEWTPTAPLTDPIDNTITYTVLKETSTLTYDPNSTEIDITVIRYISQDDDGNITLYAIGDGNDLYWLNKPGEALDPSSDVFLPVIFTSPIQIGTNFPLEFSIMEGCSATTCGEDISTFTRSSFMVVSDGTADDDDTVVTNLGEFLDPFQIEFSGSTIPNNDLAIAIQEDILNACGTSAEQILHNGIMFVMPEIGMVQMINHCRNNSIGDGGLVTYVITLNDTNIPLPPSSP